MALRGPGDELAVRRFTAADHVGDEWPRGLPAVEQVPAEGFESAPG